MRRTHSNLMIATLVTLLGIISMALPAAAETIELRGIITEIRSTPPAPFSGVVVGDTWKLSYTFDTTVVDVDPSTSAGLYRNAVTHMELKIGPGKVDGVPELVVPSGPYGSVIAVNRSTSDYADYAASIGLPDISAWGQVALWDNSGTPFLGDSLPAELPTPLMDNFPTARQFFLRGPNSTEIFLKGELQEDLARCKEAAAAAEEAALNYESAAKGVSENCPGDGVDCDGAKLNATNILTQLTEAHQTMLDTCAGTCNFGDVEQCYDGPPTTLNVGECHEGTRTCDNETWSTCTGQILPQVETCDDDLDNDCDGATDCDDSDCDGNPVCAAGVGCVHGDGICPEGCTSDNDNDCQNEITNAHNVYRNNVGSAPLEWNEEIAQHAQDWATYLDNNNLWEHNPDLSSFSQAENIASGPGLTATEIVGLWGAEIIHTIDDVFCPDFFLCGHYANIINPAFTKIGCGESGGKWVCNYSH